MLPYATLLTRITTKWDSCVHKVGDREKYTNMKIIVMVYRKFSEVIRSVHRSAIVKKIDLENIVFHFHF